MAEKLTEKPAGKPVETPAVKPVEKPAETPAVKPVEERTPVSPATGKKELDEWQESVGRKLDSLTEQVTAQGKALQAWGFEEPVAEKKPAGTSAPAAKPAHKTEPLDEWAN